MIQELLCDRAEARIQREFRWERHEDTGNAALFAKDAAPFLAERGLSWIVDDFIDLEKLNSLETIELGNGHYGCVHQIEGTDIAAKRYFPFVYQGGYNGDNCRRRVSESSILRDLIVNLALERALDDDSEYITPRYLGHLMLQGTEGEGNRHYTLMSKLDILNMDEFHDLPEEDKSNDYQLRRQFKDHCLAVLKASDSRVMLVNFDIDQHTGNMPAVRDPQTGKLQLGVIDAETFIKWNRKVDGQLIAYSNNDPHAPWLATDTFGLGDKTQHERAYREMAKSGTKSSASP